VSDQPEAPADPVTAEDGTYSAVVDEYRGLRRNGAGPLKAAILTAAYGVAITKAGEA
jgi:hypothetical protein